MEVEKWNAKVDGILSETALKRKLEARGYQVSRYIYPPGTYFSDHTHSVDKMDAILSGRFKMTMPEGSVVLQDGDILYVPRGTVHSAEVLGEQPVVSFDATRRR